MSARLLAFTWRKTTYPILNKREIAASRKFTKYSKCSLCALCIFLKTLAISVFSKVLAARKKKLSTARAGKINTLRACSQRPFDTPIYLPSLTVTKGVGGGGGGA